MLQSPAVDKICSSVFSNSVVRSNIPPPPPPPRGARIRPVCSIQAGAGEGLNCEGTSLKSLSKLAGGVHWVEGEFELSLGQT